MRLLFFIVIIFAILNFTGCYFYCTKENQHNVCKLFGGKHVDCHPEQLHSTIVGNYLGMYPLTEKLKKLILYWHNYYRNRLANGTEVFYDADAKKEVCCYPPAARMRELIWDYELEYAAYTHARNCIFAHDKCRNIPRYPIFTGQNIGFQGNKQMFAIFTINKSMEGYYYEKDKIPDKNYEAFRLAYEKAHVHTCGHFELLCHDQASRLGCAIARCWYMKKGKRRIMVMYTCDYDAVGLIGHTQYLAGKAKSKCYHWDTTASDEWSHLCKANGKMYTFYPFKDKTYVEAKPAA